MIVDRHTHIEAREHFAADMAISSHIRSTSSRRWLQSTTAAPSFDAIALRRSRTISPEFAAAASNV